MVCRGNRAAGPVIRGGQCWGRPADYSEPATKKPRALTSGFTVAVVAMAAGSVRGLHGNNSKRERAKSFGELLGANAKWIPSFAAAGAGLVSLAWTAAVAARRIRWEGEMCSLDIEMPAEVPDAAQRVGDHSRPLRWLGGVIPPYHDPSLPPPAVVEWVSMSQQCDQEGASEQPRFPRFIGQTECHRHLPNHEMR